MFIGRVQYRVGGGGNRRRCPRACRTRTFSTGPGYAFDPTCSLANVRTLRKPACDDRRSFRVLTRSRISGASAAKFGHSMRPRHQGPRARRRGLIRSKMLIGSKIQCFRRKRPFFAVTAVAHDNSAAIGLSFLHHDQQLMTPSGSRAAEFAAMHNTAPSVAMLVVCALVGGRSCNGATTSAGIYLLAMRPDQKLNYPCSTPVSLCHNQL